MRIAPRLLSRVPLYPSRHVLFTAAVSIACAQAWFPSSADAAAIFQGDLLVSITFPMPEIDRFAIVGPLAPSSDLGVDGQGSGSATGRFVQFTPAIGLPTSVLAPGEISGATEFHAPGEGQVSGFAQATMGAGLINLTGRDGLPPEFVTVSFSGFLTYNLLVSAGAMETADAIYRLSIRAQGVDLTFGDHVTSNEARSATIPFAFAVTLPPDTFGILDVRLLLSGRAATPPAQPPPIPMPEPLPNPIMNPIPEPASVLLLGSGLVWLLAVARRRR